MAINQLKNNFYMQNELNSISPIDGRYLKYVAELTNFFSETALMRYRLMIEIEYLIALSLLEEIKELPKLHKSARETLRSWYKTFGFKQAKRVKEIEKTTNHDVKAIEYFLKENLRNTPFRNKIEFVHFAITSEDVNNLAYSLMWRDALKNVYIPVLENLTRALAYFVKQNKNTPMLSLTHGQSASPTTIGKEFYVFINRVKRQTASIKKHKLQGKFGGAAGTWGAHITAYPKVDWINFSKKFIANFGLEPNIVTTQIEAHDSLVESYNQIQRINTILIDLTQDIWMYISRGVLAQKKKENEIGSSAMPHKINPIQFENAEGNLGIANAFFSYFTRKLPISRMQRDLSGSTVIRNQGTALAHSILACKNILNGISRLATNKIKLNEELDDHWEIMAEPIQTILRKYSVKNSYEQLKKLTRGKKITKSVIHDFINKLNIPEEEKNRLLNLTPRTYIGLANKLTDMANL